MAVPGANLQFRGHNGSDARGRTQVWNSRQLLEGHNGRSSEWPTDLILGFMDKNNATWYSRGQTSDKICQYE